MLDTPDLVNMESKEFKELPAEVKHELLMEMQDYHRKRHKYRNSEHSEELPEVKRMSSSTVCRKLCAACLQTQMLSPISLPVCKLICYAQFRSIFYF